MMDNYNNQKYFTPAILVSISLHGLLIGGSLWLPFAPQYSVMDAPNSLEVNILGQPVVTMVEEEIVAGEMMVKDMTGELAVHDLSTMGREIQHVKPALASQKSQGAVAVAKPLMYANPAPSYPKLARQRGWEGTVRLNVYVEQNGRPGEIGIQESSGYAVLDESALRAVKNWKFSPAQSGFLRFASKVVIPIQFILRRE